MFVCVCLCLLFRSRPETLGEKDIEGSSDVQRPSVTAAVRGQVSDPGMESGHLGMESGHHGMGHSSVPVHLSLQEVGVAGADSGWSQDVGKGESDVDIEEFDDDVVW